jgi:hypothetical protein
MWCVTLLCSRLHADLPVAAWLVACAPGVVGCFDGARSHLIVLSLLPVLTSPSRSRSDCSAGLSNHLVRFEHGLKALDERGIWECTAHCTYAWLLRPK